jgi:hypothetical protein
VRSLDAGKRIAPQRRAIRAGDRIARSAPRRTRPSIEAFRDFVAQALH